VVSRIIQCTIDPAKVSEFKNALNNQFLPRIQAQPGFLENIESLDPATGQFSCLTLWKSQADVEKYDKGLFQEVSSKLVPLMRGNPTVQTLPVENSSVHHIKAGKAAAA
jgi:quinol monooxygenase YgiN